MSNSCLVFWKNYLSLTKVTFEQYYELKSLQVLLWRYLYRGEASQFFSFKCSSLLNTSGEYVVLNDQCFFFNLCFNISSLKYRGQTVAHYFNSGSFGGLWSMIFYSSRWRGFPRNNSMCKCAYWIILFDVLLQHIYLVTLY